MYPRVTIYFTPLIFYSLGNFYFDSQNIKIRKIDLFYYASS